MIYQAEQGDITLGFVGDAMITRPVSSFKEPQFLKLLELLRSTDASIANLEQIYHHYEMSWSHTGLSYQASHPSNIDELMWMGFHAVTTATNHAYDYNEAGYLATLRHCDERGLPHAGGGMNLGEARAPAYLETAAGRIAVMSAASTFSQQSRAGAGRPDFPGKPGINALRHKTIYHVPPETFEAIKALNRGLWLDEAEENRRRFQPQIAEAYDLEREVKLFGQTFRLADHFSVETRCHEADLSGIGDWIRGASKAADWVIYALHAHESAPNGEFQGGSRVHPADFHIEFAHHAVDKGSHIVVGHGSHFLRGIEIYNGRPIFYSLGNFIYQNETISRVPAPGYSLQGLDHEHTPGDWGEARSGGGKYGSAAKQVIYRSVVATCEFSNWGLKEVRLYPVDLGFGRPMSQRGRPVLADDEVSQAILAWLQNVSEPFGTEIAIEGNVGVIRP